jgi:hypothetical protein
MGARRAPAAPERQCRSVPSQEERERYALQQVLVAVGHLVVGEGPQEQKEAPEAAQHDPERSDDET